MGPLQFSVHSMVDARVAGYPELQDTQEWRKEKKLFGIIFYVLESFQEVKLFPRVRYCWIVECYICQGS